MFKPGDKVEIIEDDPCFSGLKKGQVLTVEQCDEFMVSFVDSTMVVSPHQVKLVGAGNCGGNMTPDEWAEFIKEKEKHTKRALTTPYVGVGVSMGIDPNDLQVDPDPYDNAERAKNMQDWIDKPLKPYPAEPQDKLCTCTMQKLMREGCNCGGK